MTGRLLRRAIVGSILAGSMLRPSAARADDVVASVNGRAITAANLQLEALLRHVPDDQLPQHRQELIDDLIDQQLIAGFLTRKRTKANPVKLQHQLEQLQALIRRRGEEPQVLLQRLGIDEDQLRKRLELLLSWEAYVHQITSDEQLRERFAAQRRELDGTQLQARHILIKASPDDPAARKAAREQLARLRGQIIAGTVSFESAAAEHSQAPSGRDGGDVGYFPHRGTMTAAFADAAFALEVGELSQPVDTPFGVHLIEVTDERPGQLSLEDVRPQVFERISNDLWQQQLTRLRPAAKIERP